MKGGFGRLLVALALVVEAAAAMSASGSVGALAVFGNGLSEPESGGGGHHRCAPGVHGRDDLLGVNPLEVDRGHAEVRVATLALDHALSSKLDTSPSTGSPRFAPSDAS